MTDHQVVLHIHTAAVVPQQDIQAVDSQVDPVDSPAVDTGQVEQWEDSQVVVLVVHSRLGQQVVDSLHSQADQAGHLQSQPAL